GRAQPAMESLRPLARLRMARFAASQLSHAPRHLRELFATVRSRPALQLEPVPAVALLCTELQIRHRAAIPLAVASFEKGRPQNPTDVRAAAFGRDELEDQCSCIDERV